MPMAETTIVPSIYHLMGIFPGYHSVKLRNSTKLLENNVCIRLIIKTLKNDLCVSAEILTLRFYSKLSPGPGVGTNS